MQADTLFTHGTIATMNPARRVIDSGWIAVKDGIISALGPMTTPPPTATRSLDCSGQILIPGLIDAHAQAGHALIRSMGLHSGNRWEDICGEAYTKPLPPNFGTLKAALPRLNVCALARPPGFRFWAGVAEVHTRSVVAIGPTRAPHPRISADWQGRHCTPTIGVTADLALPPDFWGQPHS